MLRKYLKDCLNKMGKIYEQKISDFSLGMTKDGRIPDTRYSQLLKNFDAHTYRHKLVPFRDSEAGNSLPDTSKVVNFTTASVSSSLRLYALEVVSGSSKAAIRYKTDFSGTDWTTPANNESSAGSRDEEFFIHYKNYIYGARAGTNLWRHGDITGSPTWTDSWQSLTYTNMAQGLVHSKDDILYIPYDNKIAKWDNTTFTATALTLPSDRIITSICEYGIFLAIGTKSSDGAGRSIVYLWERDTSLNTLYESIDWGAGNLQILEQVEGNLIGISFNSTNSFTAKITFRQYNDNTPTIFNELVSTATYTAGDLTLSKQKINDNLYFLLTITFNGTKHQGLWKVGRIAPGLPFSLTFDRLPNNDTALTSGTLEGFYIVGDYVLIAYISSSAYGLSKTNDSAAFTATTSIWETTILNLGDSSATKKLLSVTAMTEALPSAGQIVVKYKKDEETSFTTIQTNTTDDSISKTSVNIESSGAILPQFKEITFRVESIGNAVVTGLKFKAEFIDKDFN